MSTLPWNPSFHDSTETDVDDEIQTFCIVSQVTDSDMGTSPDIEVVTLVPTTQKIVEAQSIDTLC